MAQLTEDQIAEFKEAFKMFDKDGDGSISTKELKAIMNALGQTPSDQELQVLMDEVDKDGNGSIDFEEFLEMMQKTANEDDDEDTDEPLRKTFNVFADGSDYITNKDLKQVMKNLGEDMTDNEIKDMLHEADTNGDGKIDYEEFVRMMGH